MTALYEIVPAGSADVETPPVDDLKYQTKNEPSDNAESDELLTLKLRYKQPDGEVSKKLEFPVNDEGRSFAKATPDLKFAAAATGFGMLLRDSAHKGNLTWDAVAEIATEGKGADANGYRQEMIDLVRKAKELAK